MFRSTSKQTRIDFVHFLYSSPKWLKQMVCSYFTYRLQRTGMQQNAAPATMSSAADKKNRYSRCRQGRKNKWNNHVTAMLTVEMFRTICQVQTKRQKWSMELYLWETGHSAVQAAESFPECWRWNPNDRKFPMKPYLQPAHKHEFLKLFNQKLKTTAKSNSALLSKHTTLQFLIK